MSKNNKKEDILQSALELFSEKGYEAVSPNEIVERVGITKPTLYYFFGSKEGLYDELLKIHYKKLDNLLTDCCYYTPNPDDYAKDVYPVLLQIVEALFCFAEDNTEFYLMSLSFGFAPPFSKTAIVSERYCQSHFLILEKLFKEISLVHKNMNGKERIYSCRFIAYINAQIGLWYRGHGELSVEAAKSIVVGFMHGIFS